ncbi:MAG: bifunctional molybdenum cofactor biosynthesis protein MoaC/MoaB [Alphaproteobacteria bacterium]|nr:bifunctional molybdenum cofactor biosynthesis protein MoaC/MoaB [Alphaproteobacteria bacterium]
MIDVGAKPVTYRLAAASGEIAVGPEAFALIRDRKLPKGDVLTLAEIAGIQGAKKACEMIPLCHPMGLDMVRVTMELLPETHSVRVYCLASVHAKTGIEMEALAGVNAALLTIWDLTKMVEANLRIGHVRLLAKKGGKSGLWLNPEGVPAWIGELFAPPVAPGLQGRKAAVLTLSDRAASGEYADDSGRLLKETLEAFGCLICDYRIIPDEREGIAAAVKEMIGAHAPDVLVTTGGTGVSGRDVTPEALTPLFDKPIPGVGELLRLDGAQYTPLSWSSRAVGGVIGRTLVVTLPGNPGAVREGLSALLPKLVPHLIRIIRGEKA